MTNKSVLKIDGLNKSFGDRKVIDNLSLDVEKGDIYGFLGPNGSGKTTTIKMILGLIYPDNGAIEIFGVDPKKDFKCTISRIGAIIETPRFYEGHTGFENLKMFARLYGLPASRAEEVLEVVGLSIRGKDKVKTYSLGMKQRLGIASALLNNPDLVILDEPTNGLDPQGMKEIRQMILRLSRNQNITFFVSSHFLHEVELICNKVAILKQGKKVAGGLVDDLLQGDMETMEIITTNSSEAIKKLQNIAFIKSIKNLENGISVILDRGFSNEIIKSLVHNGIDIQYAYPVNKNLEHIFLDLTEGGDSIA